MTAGSVAGSLSGARHGIRVLLLAAAALLFLIVIVIGGIAGWQSSSAPSGPSAVAVADIPSNYLALYEQGAARYGIDWAVLAAIGKIECDHGRSQAAGCNPPGTVNAKGATGPMQFLGSTWRAGTPPMTVPAIGAPTTSTSDGYATDGDGDGVANVWDPADAIAGAARLLRANGAPADYRRALYAYNPERRLRRGRTRASERVPRCLRAGRLDRRPSRPGLGRLARRPVHVQPRATNRSGWLSPGDAGHRTRRHDMRLLDVHPLGVRAGRDRHRVDHLDAVDRNRPSPSGQTPQQTTVVTRGVGSDPPPGGYQPGDLIFFGVDDGPNGHVAIWLGNGMIVQCSASGNGSNIRPLAGYVAPTGWLRWNLT